MKKIPSKSQPVFGSSLLSVLLSTLLLSAISAMAADTQTARQEIGSADTLIRALANQHANPNNFKS